MTYRLTNTNAVIRLADNSSIPADPANRDYAAYQAWLAEGNTPEPVPQPTAKQQAANVRAERDALLSGSDWTQVADAPVDQAAWAVYRQALRDIPEQAGFPASVTWPTAPA
jgi:hypothetical protein